MRYMLLLITVLAAGTALAQSGNSSATLTLYAGDCYVWHGGKSAEASLGQPLFPGDTVRTAKGSQAELAFADGTVMRIAEGSRLLVRQADSVRAFKLFWGRLWSRVAKLSSSGSQFQVETPTAVAGVRGTIFRIEVGADSSTTVQVEEGEVEVARPMRPGRMLRIMTMMESRVSATGDPTEPRKFDPRRLNRWERWTGRMFESSRGNLAGLVKALDRIAADEEKLAGEAQKLEQQSSSGKGSAGDLSRKAESIQRKAVENSRKWRMLSHRAEARLHQLQALLGRVEDQADAGGLAAKVEALGAKLEGLGSRYETAESRIGAILDSIDGAIDQAPQDRPQKSDDIIKQLGQWRQRIDQLKEKLPEIDARTQAVESRMEEFKQELIRIRDIAAAQPLQARQDFWRFRQGYFSFKQENNGLDFPVLDKAAPEARTMARAAARAVRMLPRDDPRLAQARETAEYLAEFVRQVVPVWQRTRKIEMQARIIERIIIEVDGRVKK